MRKKIARISLAAFLAAATGSAPALAGGFLEQFDLTGFLPTPIPGHFEARLVRIFHDPRCIPVQYQVNDLSPVPNPLGAPVITAADAATEFQAAFNSWNNIRTSYINLQVTGPVNNPGFAGFDMRNELTFRTPPGFNAIAVSPSTSLLVDSAFAPGDDIDGDGDSDVSATIATCADTDADGDVEFPPGVYKAGTIIDNDVSFNASAANGFRFTVNDAQIDGNGRSLDLGVVAVHEFGHSHGLSHVITNNKSKTNGRGATMFPFVDPTDPDAERNQRPLDSDDIAWSSYFYPEGSAASGPAAIQPGDIPFRFVYGLIQGEVRHGVFDEPIAGASVSATNLLTGEVFTSGYSGTTRLSYDLAAGLLYLISPAYAIVNGNYTLPVPLGLWKVGVEANDGSPVASANVSFNNQIGDLFGQLDFNEEFYNGPGQEAALEVNPGFAVPVVAAPGVTRSGIDIVTNDQITLGNFGSADFYGFGNAGAGYYYAVRFPISQIVAANPGGDVLIQAGTFDTLVLNPSVAPVFSEAILTTGTVTGTTATLNLAHPLVKETNFLAADQDFAPFYFPLPTLLTKKVLKDYADGEITDLFLVLRNPTATPFPGFFGLPPFILLDGGAPGNDAPIFGNSFFSTDGVTFTQSNTFNFRFQLLLSRDE
jgi:hypothetical protein